MEGSTGAGEPARRFARPPQRTYPLDPAPVSLRQPPKVPARQPAPVSLLGFTIKIKGLSPLHYCFQGFFQPLSRNSLCTCLNVNSRRQEYTWAYVKPMFEPASL